MTQIFLIFFILESRAINTYQKYTFNNLYITILSFISTGLHPVINLLLIIVIGKSIALALDFIKHWHNTNIQKQALYTVNLNGSNNSGKLNKEKGMYRSYEILYGRVILFV